MANHKRRAIVWGAGGHGKVIVDALLARECWEVVAILDDDIRRAGRNVLGFTVRYAAGGLSELMNQLDFEGVAVAIGDNYVRHRKFEEVRARGLAPVGVVHPSAHVSRHVELGEGVVILAGATVTPGAVLEDNVCVNTAASVDHDNHLGKSCHIFPKATLTGTVRVGDFAYVGSGAIVTPNRVIHKYSYVGAGAVVVKDVAEGVVVAGVPAEEIGRQPNRPE